MYELKAKCDSAPDLHMTLYRLKSKCNADLFVEFDVGIGMRVKGDVNSCEKCERDTS